MTFPHYFHWGSLQIHPHTLLEVVAYSGGFRWYLLQRKRSSISFVPTEKNMWLILACIFGAFFGSRILAWLESPPPHLIGTLFTGRGGKTIVGGLLGGWMGVEICKQAFKIKHSTGDIFVLPLIFGIAVGRMGCFLTGLSDQTHGIPSNLPWAIDFGDGIPRHPTQIYEILFLIVLGIVLKSISHRFQKNGALFRTFILSYLVFRFGIEFLKPREIVFFHFSMIQITCALGATFAVFSLSLLNNTSIPSTSSINA